MLLSIFLVYRFDIDKKREISVEETEDGILKIIPGDILVHLKLFIYATMPDLPDFFPPR